jgi:hypothetical protein
MLQIILVYGIGAFLLIYGILSFKAGIKKEKKEYWMIFGWDGTKSWLKDMHTPVWNIIGGVVGIISGLAILIFYRPVV